MTNPRPTPADITRRRALCIAIRAAEADLYCASILGLDTTAALSAYDAANAALVEDGGTARRMGANEMTSAESTGRVGREVEAVEGVRYTR